MPRVRTTPPANASRNRAGSVRRFLSSIACSCSPSSIGGLPVSTLHHFTPYHPTRQHKHPQATPGSGLRRCRRGDVGAAAGERTGRAPRGKGECLVEAVAGAEREGEAGGEAVAGPVG